MKSSIEQKPLLLPPQLARKIGLNAALVLQQIHYWLQKSKHLIGGVRWIYNSFTAWAAQLPMSTRTIQRAIAKLKVLRLIKVERRAAQEWDQTNWYSIDYQRLTELEALILPSAPSCRDRPCQVDAIDHDNLATSYTETSTEEINTTDTPSSNPVVKEAKQEKKVTNKEESRLAEVKALGVQPNKFLTHAIQTTEDQVFRRAVAALKEAISKRRAVNPTGYLVQALRERWGPTEGEVRRGNDSPGHLSKTNSSIPSGFSEWFNLAQKLKLVTHSMTCDDGVLRVLTNEDCWEDWGVMAATFSIAYCKQMLCLD